MAGPHRASGPFPGPPAPPTWGYGPPPGSPPPRRGRGGVMALVVVGIVVLLGVGAVLLYPVVRDQTMAEAAIGTWSCRSLTDPATAVERTAVIGDGTFSTDAGYVGTWRVEDGRVAVELTSSPSTPDFTGFDVLGLPEDAAPSGTFTMDNGSSYISRMTWSYADGRVVFSRPDGRAGASEPVAECRRVGLAAT